MDASWTNSIWDICLQQNTLKPEETGVETILKRESSKKNGLHIDSEKLWGNIRNMIRRISGNVRYKASKEKCMVNILHLTGARVWEAYVVAEEK